MHLDDSTYATQVFPTTMVSNAWGRRGGVTVQPAGPLSVFLISDFQLLLESLAQAIQLQPQRYKLLGCASVLTTPAPWGEQVPDVVLLDLDMDAQRGLLWLKSGSHDGAPRVLLFSRLGQTDLMDQAILEGGRGVIGPEASTDHVLRALDKVGQGEVWLDHATTSRLLHGQVQRVVRDAQDPVKAMLSLLTDKEQCILGKLLHHGGESAKVIASRLFISESTLRNHLTSIYEKIGVRNRNGLMAHAAQIGLTDHLAMARLAPARNSDLKSNLSKGSD